MWDRISATLGAQGLTSEPQAEAPAPMKIRRPGRMRYGYVAAAAGLLFIMVFGLRQMMPGQDELAGTTGTGKTEILTPEQLEALIASVTAEADTTEPETNGVHTTGPDTNLHTAAGSGRLALAQTVDTGTPAETTGEDGSGHPANRATVQDNAGEDDNDRTDTTTATTPVRSNVTQVQDKPATPVHGNNGLEWTPAVTGKKRGQGKTPIGISTYAANIGGTSKQTNSANGKAKAKYSDFLVQESSNTQILNSSNSLEMPELKHKIPVSTGVSVAIGLTDRLSLETGLTYSYLFSEAKVNSSTGGKYHIKQKLHYLGVPVGAKYDFLQSRHIILYGSAAAHFEMCVSSNFSKSITINGNKSKPDSQRLNVKGIQPSVNSHLGAEFKLTQSLGAYVEPGVSYYFKNDNHPENYRTENPFSFSLRAGLRINLR